MYTETSDVDVLKKELNTWISLTTSFQGIVHAC